MSAMIRILIFSLVMVACSSTPPEEPQVLEEAQPERKDVWGWTYEGERGPDNWASLNPQYSTCASGQNQSPVNLVFHQPISPRPLEVNYNEGDATVVNTGYTYRIDLTPQSNIQFQGSDYLLEKIEFRTPSEHQLSGNAMPMELQFYHRSPNGLKQAILSLFVVQGRGSLWFDKVWEKASQVPKFKSSESFRFNPAQLIPPRLTFYHYEGSLTHPPCLEGVQWIVMNTPLQLSQEQILQLRALFNNNNRPLQPLNDRKVTNY